MLFSKLVQVLLLAFCYVSFYKGENYAPLLSSSSTDSKPLELEDFQTEELLFWLGKGNGKYFLNQNLDTCLFDKCSCYTNADTKINISCLGDNNLNSFDRFPQCTIIKLNENFLYRFIDLLLIRDNNFTQIPDNSFANLNINNLHLENNSLVLIRNSSFSGIKNLNKLTLRERNLKIIEPMAFMPLKNILLELDLSNIQITDQFMNQFSRQINDITRLERLNLNNNMITQTDPEWFIRLKNLIILNLASNNITHLEKSSFKYLFNLERLVLKNNRLAGCLDQTPFLSRLKTLKRLNLASNYISCLPEFDNFEKLRYLDLSNNLIENITSKTFSNLNRLYVLDLNNNRIKNIHFDAFRTHEALFYLRLKNNYIDSIPSIKGLQSLLELDLSNQNGKLLKLNNYQFERLNAPIIMLTINLERNDIKSIEKSSFCSRFIKESFIDTIKISLQTLINILSLNPCLFIQLYSNNISSLMIDDVNNINHAKLNNNKSICVCELKAFLNKFKINPVGIDCNDYSISNQECINYYSRKCLNDINDYRCKLKVLSKEIDHEEETFNNNINNVYNYDNNINNNNYHNGNNVYKNEFLSNIEESSIVDNSTSKSRRNEYETDENNRNETLEFDLDNNCNSIHMFNFIKKIFYFIFYSLIGILIKKCFI